MAKSKKQLTEKERNDLIVAQAVKEIVFNRRYKQGKVKNWQKNENMYYGVKLPSTESRANVDLGRMQEFVHNLLSKIDNPLIFKFRKRKEAQLKRVNLLNALRKTDANLNHWDMKDLVGKKQSLIYGRAIYCYYADSYQGYKANLDPVDVYDYLIDPSGGGIDLDLALNMGRYGVVKSKEDLLDGVEEGIYIKEVVDELTAGTGNNTDQPQEEINKRNRMYGQNTIGPKENRADSDNKYKFWEWYTTWYDPDTKTSERYYLLMNEKAGSAIRVCKLTELFDPNPLTGTPDWPFWSWAAFPDLTEFWTPSYCDYAREIFQAQGVSVNQALDNSEAINKPQKLVNVGAIENLAELKYRRDGIIRTKGDYDAARAIQMLRPPAIDTPLKMFELLEKIQEKASGVTIQTKGVDDESGSATIYEGNQENTADRFGLLNKSYAFGYQRFARLYQAGVREHLTKKTAVELVGPDGVEMQEIKRNDIFKGKETFEVLVEASDAEEQASLKGQEAKTKFITDALTAQNQPNATKFLNPIKVFEAGAKAVGFTEDQIKEFTDMNEFGNQELMSEAAEDIESLLNGDKVEPNAAANNAYKQRIVDYMLEHRDDMDDEQFNLFKDYVTSIQPVVVANETRALNQHLVKTLSGPPPANGTGQPAEQLTPGGVQ